MFYHSCAKDLKPYRPIPKFICVKSIIFLTFWQSLILAYLVWAGIIQDSAYSASSTSLALQDLILCLEMPIFAWMHYYSFPWTDYNDSRLSSRLSFIYAVRDVIGFKDVLYDTYVTFIQIPRRLSNNNETQIIDIWADDALDEEAPMLGGSWIDNFREDSHIAVELEFSDPDEEEEMDYESARRLEFGDFNFPVIHSDPRFSAPPNVQIEISNLASDFTNQLEGKIVPRRKEFETAAEIEDRLLGWQNEALRN
jgi:hypothetical protein